MTTSVRVVGGEIRAAGGEIPDGGVAAANARLSFRERRGWVLQLRDANGRIGLGEASPLPRYSPDDLDQARRALETAPWTALPEGGVLDLSRPFVEAVAPALGAGALDPVPSARFAVETALLDLAGQALGRPAWQVLLPGASPPPECPLAALLPAGASPEGLVDAGRAAVAAGHRTLKVKIGRPGAFDDELLGLQSLRMAVGDEVALRLDANGTLLAGLSLDRERILRRRLEALAQLGPELVEEPIAAESLFLARTSPVPLALDETLQRPEADRLLDQALELGLCQAVVLKPMVLGGLGRCLDLAGRARKGGARSVASHLFDGPVALAAAATLALVLGALEDPGDRFAAGLGEHPGLAAWGIVDGAEDDPSLAGKLLPMRRGSVLRPEGAPGLGVDPAALDATARAPRAAETARTDDDDAADADGSTP
jgi:o-succinylbenzoate synthase